MPARIEGPLYRDIYTLHIWRRRAAHDVDIAMGDGTWRAVEEGTVMPEGAGIEIPGDVFEDVFNAFLAYKGFNTHDPTEVRVLREWLGREMTQVNKLIDKVIK